MRMTFFEEKSEERNEVIFCKVKDWRKECSFIFKDLKGRKRGKSMKFKRIYIEITNICNLSCSFCSKVENKPDPKVEAMLDEVQYEAIKHSLVLELKEGREWD